MAEEKMLGRESVEGSKGEFSPERKSPSEGELEIFPLETGIASNEQKEDRAEGKYKEILATVVPTTASSTHTDEDVLLDAKHVNATVDEESKIQKILDLAGTKGVVHAVKVARTLDDYYALDQVHDALADRLYEGLLARGLITKE